MTKSNAIVRVSGSAQFQRKPSGPSASARFLLKLSVVATLCLAAIILQSCKSSGGEPISIAITPPSASVDQGQQINFTANLGNDLFNQGVTWTLTGTNCVTNGCGKLTNTTTTSVTYTATSGLASSLSVTLTATAVANAAATKTATITVELPLTFTITNTVCSTTPTSSQLPCGSNGVPYSATIAVTGGVAPYKFSLSSGSLPAGLSLNQSGVITGTPSGPITGQPNPAVFTIQATDNSTQPVTATQQYSISISPPPPLSITAVSPLQSGFVHDPYSTFVAKTGGVPPFKWSIIGGSLQGSGLTFNGSTGQISGIPIAAGPYSITVHVTDSALPQQMATSSPLAISIQVPSQVTISTSSLPTATTATPYSTSISASGGIPPYTWSLVSGQLPSGLTFASGTATIAGTPILATTSTFTVQVTDSEVPPATPVAATFTITVSAGTNSNSLLNGQYSFLFKGFDDNGAVALVGSLLADGTGKITGGSIDSARAPTSTSIGIVTGQSLTGSYSMGTDGRGTMELIATNSLNVTLTTDYNLVLDSEGNVHFFENNSSTSDNDVVHTHGEGIMKPANSSSLGASSFNGNYAFVFTGPDLAKSPTALGGVIHADGLGSITPGTGDYNEAGTFSSAISLSGSFTFDTGTRGGASLTFELPGKSAYTLDYLFRFVSPSDLFFVASDTTDATHPRLSGEMILQSPTVQFTAATAMATPSVATGTGVNGGKASVLAGLLTPGCSGQANCVALSYDENSGGTIGTPSFTGSFQMSSNGRVALTNLGAGGSERVAVAYLTGAEQGLTIGSDAAVTTGQLDQQMTGVAFSASLVDGGYALMAGFPAETAVNNVIGEVNAQGTALSLTGDPPNNETVDEFTPPSTPNLGQVLAATYGGGAGISPTTGRGTISLNPLKGLPSTMAFYIVSPSSFRAVSIDPTDQHPEVFFFDH